MGLLNTLKHAVGWPVTGPLFLTRYSMEQVRNSAISELTDPEPVRDELKELHLRLERGKIDEAEYQEEEARLMRRLRQIREWRERLGMPTRGGPVRTDRTRDGDGGVSADIEVDLD